MWVSATLWAWIITSWLLFNQYKNTSWPKLRNKLWFRSFKRYMACGKSYIYIILYFLLALLKINFYIILINFSKIIDQRCSTLNNMIWLVLCWLPLCFWFLSPKFYSTYYLGLGSFVLNLIWYKLLYLPLSVYHLFLISLLFILTIFFCLPLFLFFYIYLHVYHNLVVKYLLKTC